MKRGYLILILGFMLTEKGLATNWIYAWETTGTYDINQYEHKVEILSDGTFKFYALEGSMTGHINSITIPGDVFVDGDVYLYVASPYHPVGAEYVKRIDLSRAAFSEIKELRLSGNLAEDGTLYATRLSGDFAVGGDILNDIEIWLLDAGVIDVAGDFRNLTIHGDCPGNIVVAGDAWRFLTIDDDRESIISQIIGCLPVVGDAQRGL